MKKRKPNYQSMLASVSKGKKYGPTNIGSFAKGARTRPQPSLPKLKFMEDKSNENDPK